MTLDVAATAAGRLPIPSAPMRLCAEEVTGLQAELRRLQLLHAGEAMQDGELDATTTAALRRFQWFASRVPGALTADGRYIARPLHALRVNGVAGPSTRQLIELFRLERWAATGLLVKVDFRHFSHVRPNAGFAGILGGNHLLGVCERECAQLLGAIDSMGGELGVHAFVNELFHAETGSGAGGPPASNPSADLFGRALRLQLGPLGLLEPGVNPEPAWRLLKASSDSPMGMLRDRLKTVLHCRYGGDLDPADPSSFECPLPPTLEARAMHRFFDQLQYRQALSNPAAIPDAA